MADTYLTLTYGSETVAASVGGLASVIARLATVSTDVATLVADGASPTQAHVNTLNTDFGLLQSRFSTFSNFQTSAALLVNIDKTQIPTVSVLRQLLNLIIIEAAEQGMAP